jgi:hypothetical protein
MQMIAAVVVSYDTIKKAPARLGGKSLNSFFVHKASHKSVNSASSECFFTRI